MSMRESSGAPMSKTQADLEENTALQTVLHTREMIQEALRQAMMISPGAKSSGPKTVSGTSFYAWGAGAQGQLGQPVVKGQLRSMNTPTTIQFEDLSDTLVRASCGAGHVASLTDSGEVWAWGYGRSGQLGYVMDRSTNQPQPKKVDTLVKGPYWTDREDEGSKTPLPICDVACGLAHTIALDVEGTMHSWGAGKNGQLGHRKCEPERRVPKMVSFKWKIKQIACGDMHNAAIDERGRVFTWGSGDAGQLGQGYHGGGGKETIPSPCQVTVLAAPHLGKMSQVACGAQFTACVSARGELHVWGFGQYLYSTIDGNFAYEPEKIQLPLKVKSVACGRAHILALTEGRDVYCWGEGKEGQLGHGRTTPCNFPRIVLEGKKIVQVECGRYHSVALNTYGVLYTWGCGESGQLGHADDVNLLLPKVCEPLLSTIVGQVSCGEHHSAAVCSARVQEIDAQMTIWMQNEMEEFELKQDAAETCPHGLGSKELAALQTDRDALRLARSLRTERKASKLEKEIHKELEEIPDIDKIKYSIASRIESQARAQSASSAGSAAGEASAVSFRPDSRDSTFSREGEQSSAAKSRPKKKGKGKGRGKGSVSSRSSLPDLSGHTSGISPFGDDDVAYDEGTLANSTFRFVMEEDEDLDANGSRKDSFYESMMSQTRQGSKYMQDEDRRGSALVRSVNVMRTTFHKDGVELMKQVRASITVGDMDMDQWEIEKAWQTMLGLKESCDSTKDGADKKEEVLMKMLTELQALEESGQNFEKYVAEMAARVRYVGQALSTVKLNWKEALENRKNYEDILDQLTYESRMQQYKLNHFKEMGTNLTKQLAKVTKLRDHATEQEEAAVREWDLFAKDFVDRSEKFTAYKRQFEGLGLTMQLARERTEAYAQDRLKKNEKFNSKEAAKLSKINGRMETAMLEQELKRQDADLNRQKLEEKYNKLIAATNLNDPSEIIDKYYLMEQVRENLMAQIDNNTSKTKDLEGQKDALAMEQSKLDVSGGGQRRFFVIDQKRTEFNAVANKLTEKESKLIKKRQDQARYTQGIFALAKRMSPVLINDTEAVMGASQTPDGVVKVLDLIEAVLATALADMKADNARARERGSVVEGEVIEAPAAAVEVAGDDVGQ